MSETTWLIAAPVKINDFPAFTDVMKASASEHCKLELLGLLVVPGHFCLNFGLLLDGEEHDARVFVSQVTRMLSVAACYEGPIIPDRRLTAGVFSYTEE